MKFGRYLLISTTILGLMNSPVTVLADNIQVNTTNDSSSVDQSDIKKSKINQNTEILGLSQETSAVGNRNLPAITGNVINGKLVYTSSDVIDYRITIPGDSAINSTIEKGDEITLKFKPDNSPMSKTPYANISSGNSNDFDLNISGDTVTLVANKSIDYTSHPNYQIDIFIAPSFVPNENVSPMEGYYAVNVSYARGSEQVTFPEYKYKVVNQASVMGGSAGTYAKSAWGTKPSNKYYNNYFNGGDGSGNGKFEYTQPTQTFSSGFVNPLEVGNTVSIASMVVTSDNPIDPDTFTVWDGVQGALVEVTSKYTVTYNQDYTVATVTGGMLTNGLVGGNLQSVMCNFSVITPESNTAQTTVSGKFNDVKINGQDFTVNGGSSTAEYLPVNNGNFIPIILSKDYTGTSTESKTKEIVDNPNLLITRSDDYTDGQIPVKDDKWVVNGESINSADKFISDASLLSDFKNHVPGTYYVHFKVTNSFNNSNYSVSKVTITDPVKAADVTAKYVDDKGAKISSDVVKTGNVGDDYKTTKKDIKGYTFKEVQGNETGKFTDQAQTVTYVYTKDPVKAADVTAKYVDDKGTKISSDVVKTGNVGDDYKTTKKDIKGYTFKEVQGNETGKFTDQAQTVTYVYTKDPVKAADVTAKYVDDKGTKISSDVVKTGNVGDDYKTTKKEIKGYTFKEVQGNETGKFTGQAQTVTYIYTKDATNDNSNSDNSNGGNPDSNNPNSNNSTESNSNGPTDSKQNKLPQTGDNTSTLTLSIIGALMIGFMISIRLFSRKNKKQ